MPELGEFTPLSSSRDPLSQVRRRLIITTLAWLMFVGLLVVGSLIFNSTVVLLESPHEPTIVAADVARQPMVAPVNVAPSQTLLQAYGPGILNLAGREARRVGMAGAAAVLCGRQSEEWLSAVRAALPDEMSERYTTYEEDSRIPVMMMEFATAQFRGGEQEAAEDFARRGKDAACADLIQSSDYRAAQSAARRITDASQ